MQGIWTRTVSYDQLYLFIYLLLWFFEIRGGTWEVIFLNE